MEILWNYYICMYLLWLLPGETPFWIHVTKYVFPTFISFFGKFGQGSINPLYSSMLNALVNIRETVEKAIILSKMINTYPWSKWIKQKCLYLQKC